MDAQYISKIYDFDTNELKLKGFKVYEIEPAVNPVPSYSRRDFYKICLVTGNSLIHYADKSVEMKGSYLFFGNPHVPYSSELIEPDQNGFSCLFTEEFLKTYERTGSIQESPLIKIGRMPIYCLNNQQKEFITTIFQKMIAEQDTSYVFKNDLIRNYISLVIHEALRMQPSENFIQHKNASSRITSLFFELLERQFPIESAQRPLRLKTAQDFANNLSVHVNHLNRSVRDVTGKPTTAHIAERIISEAKALLQHTDWSVADIAYGLGFEYPTYFNNYFKRLTGKIPKSERIKLV
jgi:AraC family transcriptional regulator, transcriptional activator of pobA